MLFEGNETEYVIAIAGGWEEGHFYIISTKGMSLCRPGGRPDGDLALSVSMAHNERL